MKDRTKKKRQARLRNRFRLTFKKYRDRAAYWINHAVMLREHEDGVPTDRE